MPFKLGHYSMHSACLKGVNKRHGSRDLGIEIQGFKDTLCTGAE
jgi:hypothetical protein